MSGEYWQITFEVSGEVSGGVEVIAEMMEAGVDARGVSVHRGGDEEAWCVMLMTEGVPDEEHIRVCLGRACEIVGQAMPEVRVAKLPARDWLAENRKSFPPLDIGRFWIYGSHVEDSIPDGKIGLKIDAGQAFGSGSHATTRGCIVMLEKHCPEEAELKITDIGCGSGILAMVAAKLRPDAEVIAADNDARAVLIATQNATDNDVGRIKVGLSDGYQGALVKEGMPYDVIMANILPSPLIDMAGDAAKALAEDGMIILSGLLDDQQDKVITAYRGFGLYVADKYSHDGWASLVLRKRR